jgi:hypothetical protein
MLVVVVERWSHFDGSVAYPWAVWLDGKRVHMGRACDDPDRAEAEALAFCREELGREPDRVRRL